MYISDMLLDRKLLKTVIPLLSSPEAIIISGMRRTGKTSFLRLIYNQIPSTNKLFLDLENPINQKYFEEMNFDRVKASLGLLGLDWSQPATLFLDEIQLVKTLPQVLKYLMDHNRLKCFLTGSASFYLRNVFTESLAGRKYIFELHPLDFEEFLLFKGSPLRPAGPDTPPTFPVYETLAPFYDEYLSFGGFPGVVLKSSIEEKRRSLDDIFTSYFQLEVLRLGDYRKNDALRDLILLLMQRVGSAVDIQKLSAELRLSRITVAEYLSFLEGTYFIKTIRPFSRNRDTEIRKMAKVYACDAGLANHLGRIPPGSLFENNVFQTLRTRGEVNYYRRKNGSEIDFILNKEVGYEAKETVTQGDLTTLERLSHDLGLKDFKIVALHFSPHFAGHPRVVFAPWL
jgi:predicted AAA+ superfamily ATPase